MIDLLMLFGTFTLPFALLGAAAAVVRFRGLAWRLAAALPLLAVAAYWAFVLAPDWSHDPTSHNLFPFELGIRFWPAAPYLVVLVVAYRKTRRAQLQPRT